MKIFRHCISITSKCNIKCPFCFAGSSPKCTQELSFDKFKTIVDNANNQDNCFDLILTGGEPVLNNNLIDFFEYACKSKAQMLIVDTNGTLLKSNKLDEILLLSEKYNKRLKINISYNYYIIENFKDQWDTIINTFINKIKKFPLTTIMLNLRYRFNNDEDEKIITFVKNKAEELKSPQFKFFCIPFEYRGRARTNKMQGSSLNILGMENLESIEYVGYASDGTCLGKNLKDRSEYEFKNFGEI